MRWEGVRKMKRIVSRAVIVSKDEELIVIFKKVAKELDVKLSVIDSYKKTNSKSKYIIDSDCYSKPVRRASYILRNRDIKEVYKYCTDIIFDFRDENQVFLAFTNYINLPEVREKRRRKEEVFALLKRGKTVFKTDDYDFNFKCGTYLYKGEAIYLSNTEQVYVKRKVFNLVRGSRANDKSIKYGLRKKFGKEFLKEYV